ncbi:MAG: response regulator, partial [Leucobacter sp.]
MGLTGQKAASPDAPGRIRVLVVDDEALMRAGIRLMVDGVAGIAVVGEAADGAEALEQADRLDPDVILMDIRMPV